MKDINNKESGVKMCSNCGYVRKESHVPPQFPENICPSCKTDYKIAVKYVKKVQRPFLSEVFFWLSIISLIAGFYLAYIFLPDKSQLNYNEHYKATAYTWSLIWFISSFIQASLFAAIGSIIDLSLIHI